MAFKPNTLRFASLLLYRLIAEHMESDSQLSYSAVPDGTRHTMEYHLPAVHLLSLWPPCLCVSIEPDCRGEPA